jgi:hypothetical protein
METSLFIERVKNETNNKNNYLKVYFLIQNFFILYINLYYLLKSKKNLFKNNKFIKFYKENEFKNSDIFPISLAMRTYKRVSNLLNNKYFINIFSLNKKEENSNTHNFNLKRKAISLYSVDLFDSKYHRKWLKKILRNKYYIKFDSNNPDYLFYNIFGNEHLNYKYNNSIKIAIFTENQIPNFNEADYAIGQSHINYLDRYFKFPIFLWHIKDLKKVRERVLKNKIRKKFCAAVISNSLYTDGFRMYFINELNKYKLIDMGGQYKNNIGGPVKDKIKFLSSYKFSISMENSEGDGYLSEKIIDSFYSGTIPIFYGDYMIDEYINPKVYILIKGEKDIKEKIEYIKKIDNDDEKYKNILKENVLIDNKIDIKIYKEEKEFLYHIFDQDKEKAFRKN